MKHKATLKVTNAQEHRTGFNNFVAQLIDNGFLINSQLCYVPTYPELTIESNKPIEEFNKRLKRSLDYAEHNYGLKISIV